MENIKKEKLLENSTGPIFINTAETIIYQMKNCLCKIKTKHSGNGSGFFCKIPYPDQSHLLPVLVTASFVKDFDVKEGTLNISLNDDNEFREIKLNNRKIFINKELACAFIEILPEDKINNFLEIDGDLFKDDKEIEYIYRRKSIYVLHYPRGERAAMNSGILKNLVNETIIHLCNTEPGSSGGPIILLDNLKVIGFHKGSKVKLNENEGTLIKYPISEFIKNNIGH